MSSAERGAGGINSGIDENPDTALYDDLDINNAFVFTINHCANTGLGNEYSQALVKGHTQTTLGWNQANLWLLDITYIIYCLIPLHSVDGYTYYTASSYYDLILVTARTLF